jgi:Domain of unknown function (DUF4350)
MPRNRILDIAIVCTALALLLVLTVLRAARPSAEFSQPSTYDAGGNGYAALYELLAREGVAVARFERPIGEFAQRGGALVLSGDRALFAAAPGTSALRALDTWVRRGGTLFILGDTMERDRDALGLPRPRPMTKSGTAIGDCGLGRLSGMRAGGEFTMGFTPACERARKTLLRASGKAVALAYARGQGTVVVVSTPSVFANRELIQHDNARFAYALFGGLGPVAFDERIHGHATGRTFWEVLPQPMRVAIVLACVVVALAIIGANLPFAPPVPVEPPAERDSGAYIASLARMLRRGGAERELLSRLERHAETVLGPRTAADERARSLLAAFQALRDHPRPGVREVLAAGRLFASVQKEYEW